jgi:hypothetical protein
MFASAAQAVVGGVVLSGCEPSLFWKQLRTANAKDGFLASGEIDNEKNCYQLFGIPNDRSVLRICPTSSAKWQIEIRQQSAAA